MKRTFRHGAKSGRADVQNELALHLDLRAKEFERAGMDPEAARGRPRGLR